MRLKLPLISTLLMLSAASPVAAQPAQGDPDITWFEMFFRTDDTIGQAIIVFLIVLSMFTLGYIVKLMTAYRRALLIPQPLCDQIRRQLSEKKFADALKSATESESYLGQLVGGAMREAPGGYSAMERALEEIADAQTSGMLRPIEYLNVVGNIAPMIGLFGTVYGMIVAFQTLVTAGRPEPAELAAGISTALVTTLWGLAVAIPALAGYALIRNKVDALTADGLVLAEQLLRPFQPKAKKAAQSDA